MIIDMHAHLWHGRYESDERKILTAMDVYGIDEVYVSGLEGMFPDEAMIETLNSTVADCAKRNAGRIKGYVYVSPDKANAMDVVKRGIEDQGMIGIKLWVATYCDEPCVNPVIEYAIDNGLPVLLHSFHKATPQCPRETTGIHVANLARRYPEAKLIMAHISGNCYDGIRAVRDLKNVWVDICCSIFQQDALTYSIEEIGVDRLLHGSDMPGSYLVNLGQVEEAVLDAESRAKILGLNAKKLFDTSFRL